MERPMPSMASAPSSDCGGAAPSTPQLQSGHWVALRRVVREDQRETSKEKIRRIRVIWRRCERRGRDIISRSVWRGWFRDGFGAARVERGGERFGERRSRDGDGDGMMFQMLVGWSDDQTGGGGTLVLEKGILPSE